MASRTATVARRYVSSPNRLLCTHGRVNRSRSVFLLCSNAFAAAVSYGMQLQQQIGTVGLTAGDGRPSMHFETRRMQGDEPVAVDPLTVLPR